MYLIKNTVFQLINYYCFNQVKVLKCNEELGKNDVIVMATDGLWDVVSNKVCVLALFINLGFVIL